ncbi:hypothetical protein PFFVO_03452 [Plasmodium falciparum Vietnam Oak-Knoll (FVO)]|uniref:Uncharacterized protein n=2 Tax=Plasmodium falciparum TaxID=5833 RepID=A0A024V509_PLAFA|nr:hypothetical protein PFFVO_03452 [Plasmodium falciparum Vietnam Oak-Knoll (FVO)]
MGPKKPVALRGGGGGEDIDKTSAKHLLDSIGKRVHAQVQNEAAGRGGSELKGLLSLATFSSEEMGDTNDPCRFNYTKVIKATDNNETCGKGKEDRFSKNRIAEYDKKKIRGNNGGASAPYRKLSLCNKNLETINIDKIDNKQKLLAEVCLAAKYEGESITLNYPKYQTTYGNFPFELCTVLARSFADIGDIIRGRDLYGGNNKRRQQLEENLRKIFANIYEELSRTPTKNGQKSAKDRYGQDSPNFYKLREDWWEVNRQQVWNAITCKAEQNDKYFREKNSNGNTCTVNKCKCATGDVLTNFDYVPQYLRWFEEWAEDFCRKRKHKLQNAKEQCRKPNGNDKYCSRNGYDCTQTIRGRNKLVSDTECTNCSVVCTPFVNWIDNQKLEFLKQKNKYADEMQKYTNGITSSKRKKRGAGGTTTKVYDGYEKKFYGILKTDYGDVDKFLEKLNDEDVCKKNNDDEEGGQIDFKTVNSGKNSGGDDSNKTFYRTTYCEACPWCGAQKKSGGNGKWEAKKEDCSQTKIYNDQKKTDIPILTADKGQSDIFQKYRNFCDSVKNTANGATGGGQIKKWECYYDDSDKSNNCVQGEWKDFQKGQKVTSYNAFFWK